jgi:hypothetical protein
MSQAQIIKALPHQVKILSSDRKFNLMVGGVGSGKSYTIGDLLVKYRAENVANEVFIGANTHRQLRDSTIKAATDRLQMYGFTDNDWEYQENKGFFNFQGMKCYLRSLESVDKAIAGLTVDKMIVDEYAFCGRPNQSPEYIHKKIIQRLRGKNGANQFVALTSPNGVNFLHDIWVTNKTSQHYLVQCRTKDNIFLPDDYYEALVAAYGGEDSALAQQELFGEFIDVLQNNAYYAFDPDKFVVDLERKPGTLLVGLDFNVSPYCATIAQYDGHNFYFLDEIVIEDNGDSYKFCKQAIDKGYGGAIVYPDSTGRNRKTSGESDFNILREYGFSLANTRNPAPVDRVNNLNRLFMEGRVFIDPKCKWLIRDLCKVAWRGGKLDQVTDKRLTHSSDGAGYLTWELDPIGHNIDADIIFD